jgi:protoporphyrinogen oxidase
MKSIIGSLDPNDRTVSIWGAGFSGLVLGHYLKQKGLKVKIYERAGKAGGKIATKKTPYGMIESAANALYLNADSYELLKELRLEPVVASKKLKRLIYLNGRPRRALQLKSLARFGTHLHKKPPLISDGLTVAEFFRPLLGEETVHNVLAPALGGIYATPPESLHFKSIFDHAADKAQFDSYWEFLRSLMKSLKEQEKPEITGSVSFENGMQELVDGLAHSLKSEIKLNHKEPFRIRGNTVLCTDAHTASELLSEFYPQIAMELGRIRYQELTSVTVFLKREIRSLHRAFGVLIPTGSPLHSLGVLNNKAIFPGNNPNVFSYTLISREDLTEAKVHQDLKTLYSEFVPEDIEHLQRTHWERALPVYDLQRYLSVKRLHQLAHKEKNLAIFGNYVAGIGLREMVSAAKAFTHGL